MAVILREGGLDDKLFQNPAELIADYPPVQAIRVRQKWLAKACEVLQMYCLCLIKTYSSVSYYNFAKTIIFLTAPEFESG